MVRLLRRMVRLLRPFFVPWIPETISCAYVRQSRRGTLITSRGTLIASGVVSYYVRRGTLITGVVRNFDMN